MASALEHLCAVGARVRTRSSRSARAPSGRSAARSCPGPPKCARRRASLDYDPRDLTVTVGAGTSVAELAAVLAEHGQECPLDPRDPSATVGGVLATGLSGPRRLRHGPLRDRVLEVRFVTADGRLVKGGGPTVKNVTGFDLPRLLVGSLGTIGVIAQVTLRCQPLPSAARWSTSAARPAGGAATAVPPLVRRLGRRHLCRAARRRPADDLARRAACHRWRAVRARAGLPRRPAPRPGVGAPGRGARVGRSPRSHRRAAVARRGRRRHRARRRPTPRPRSPKPVPPHASFGGWLLREAGAPGLDGVRHDQCRTPRCSSASATRSTRRASSAADGSPLLDSHRELHVEVSHG